MDNEKFSEEKVKLILPVDRSRYYSEMCFSENVKEVTIKAETDEINLNTFFFEGDGEVIMRLNSCRLSAYLGQSCIVKKRGKLILRVAGEVEICGSDALFGPSSFGGNSAVEAEEAEICLESGARLELYGGKSFSSLFSGRDEFVEPINCKVWHSKNPWKRTKKGLSFFSGEKGA